MKIIVCSSAGHTLSRRFLWLGASVAALALPRATLAQFNQIKDVIGDRIEAVTILGGDYGISGASYRTDDKNTIDISKFGGSGDVGGSFPKPLFDDCPIKWQPRLQGNMGYLTAKNTFRSGDLEGDTSKY